MITVEEYKPSRKTIEMRPKFIIEGSRFCLRVMRLLESPKNLIINLHFLPLLPTRFHRSATATLVIHHHLNFFT